LLLNKIYGVPVFPVFLAEMKAQNEFMPFKLDHEFPDVVHRREHSSQLFMDDLRYLLMNKTQKSKFTKNKNHSILPAKFFQRVKHISSKASNKP
jgi:hypothetical protein